MGMIVKMFQPRFAPLVEGGVKLNTVRPTPKRMPRVGEKISLRAWTGKPYRSKQRVLRESTVRSVQEITIESAPTMGCFIYINMIMLSLIEATTFAVGDGFKSLKDMSTWFEETHGLPFKGILISWY